MVSSKKKNPVAAALGPEGVLHRATKTPKGKKIPLSKLRKLAAGSGPNVKRAKVLINLEQRRKKK